MSGISICVISIGSVKPKSTVGPKFKTCTMSRANNDFCNKNYIPDGTNELKVLLSHEYVPLYCTHHKTECQVKKAYVKGIKHFTCKKITTINHNILQWTSLLTKWHTKIPAKYFGICSVSGTCAISRATYKYTVGQTLPAGQSLTPMARMDHGGGGGGDSSPIALYLYLV